MKSYPQKTPPHYLKTMKPDTTAPEDDGELDNDDISDGEGGTSTFIDKSLNLGSENDDNFNNDVCMRKRAKNNSRERERKEKIKNDMNELRSLLPLDMQLDKKQTHHDMLQLTISYMRSLLYQSNSLKLNQITASTNQDDRETDLQKENEELRLELAKYKSFFSNAGLPQGIDLSHIIVNWRLKTSDELVYNPNVNVDVNLPVFQQQQQYFNQQQQQFNQFQSQGIFQNVNQQTLTQFTAMTNQAQQLQPTLQQIQQQQQQLAFNQNQLQQISFAQQSFSLTQHSEFQPNQQFQQQQQQQLGFVQQNVQQTFEMDSTTTTETHNSSPTQPVTASNEANSFQDFLPEVQEFATSSALEMSINNNIIDNNIIDNNIINNNMIDNNIIANNISDNDFVNSLATSTANNEIMADPQNIENNISNKNEPTSNEPNDNKIKSCNLNSNIGDIQTSFIEDQNLLPKNSLSGLLTSNDVSNVASTSSSFMSFESSTSDSTMSQHQQQLSNTFQDGQIKSSTTFNIDGANFDSDCNRFESFGNSLTISQQQMQQHQQVHQPHQQVHQPHQQIIGQQQFHYGPNSELLADGSSTSISLAGSNDLNNQQGMQGSLILQNGQLILVNNNLTSNTNHQVNNQQQFQQNFFMQTPQQPTNVLTQQNGFIGQNGNMTIQADQLLGQQHATTQFVGPNGSINILTGHGLQTIPQAGGQIFQNSMGVINPVNVLGGSLNHNFNQTLTQGQVMMSHKTSDQPQALILPDGQIIPVVTQPNLLFPSQQCIPVTGSLLVPSVGASQNRALSNIISAKPQPISSVCRSKKRQNNNSQPPSTQNVTLPPSMTAVLTPEGNVILSFPTASANQNASSENKSNVSISGTKSSQRPLMPKPSNVIQQQQNIFDAKMFTSPQTPFFQNILNIQPSTNLPMIPLVQHQHIIQPLAAPTDLNDLSNRGIECISPPTTQSGDLSAQCTNYNSSFNQINNHINGTVFPTTNQNEVTTSTGAVEPIAASNAKKKVKKKKKKRLSTASTNESSSRMVADNNNKYSTGDFICGQEKEVDITDFSDLIRMEPMTPRPPDTSARNTPSHQFPQTPTMSTPLMTSQVKQTPHNNSLEVDDIFKMEKQIVTESMNIQNSLEVVNCSLGDCNARSFTDSLLIASPPRESAFHSFSTVSISPSMVSMPTCTYDTSQIASSCETSLLRVSSNLNSSTCNDTIVIESTPGNKKRKQARKSLDFRDQSINLKQSSTPPVLSTNHVHGSDSSTNDSSKQRIVISNSTTSSIQAPISSIIPLIKDEPKRGTKRPKTSQPKSSRPNKTSKADNNKTSKADDNKTSKADDNKTLTADSSIKSLSRRTRSQSKSRETSEQQISFSSFDDSPLNFSPPSKKRNTKQDQTNNSALKRPSNVPSPTINRQLVISVEKLGDHVISNSYQTVATPLSDNNNGLKNVISVDEGNHILEGFEPLTTTEEGTQTLRSELKSLKQERRAKKLQDKKRKLSDKKTSDNSGLIQSPVGAVVDDSVQLDIELFNLVDQVERNMTQTDPKCRPIQRSDAEDAKGLKIEENGRGKENSLTLKLKRADNQSNFTVESPVDSDRGSPTTQVTTRPYSPVDNFSTLQPSKASSQMTNNQSADNSFYGSRYLPNTSDVFPSARDNPDKNNEDSNQNNSNKPYFVLKQPNLLRTDSTNIYNDASNTLLVSNNIRTENSETRDIQAEDRSKGGHAIFQSLAKTLSVPSKQVSSKMAAQLARQKQEQKEEIDARNNKRVNKKSKTEEIEKPEMKESGDADCNQDVSGHKTMPQQTSSPNCYDLSLDSQSKQDKQNPSKPLNQCMETSRPQSSDRAMRSCAVTNLDKILPSCNQEKEKKQKEQDLLDCTYQHNQSKPIDGRSLGHQEDYQLGQVAKQHDDSQSNRRRSRNDDEEKRSSSTGYHQANNSQSGHPYYKDQAFAGSHGYYVPNYFDVLQASSSRFNPFETSSPLSFFRDCASVFPAFQTPAGSFGSDFSCQRNSSGKEEHNNRRSVESNNRNSLEGRNSQQQQQTSSLPSCKSASNSYHDNHQHQSADKSKQSANAKKSSKTPAPSYEAVFDHMNPFFNFTGLSPNKNHHHLSSPYFPSSNFFPEASRNKGATLRTIHHGADGFDKTSGLEFTPQEFSRHQQQSRTNSFIGNSVPAHHSFGFGGFLPDAHQMTPPLGQRGAQPPASNYYNNNNYSNQQQAMASRNISRGSSHALNPDMPFNHFWGHQQATFDPARAIGHPFSSHPFSM